MRLLSRDFPRIFPRKSLVAIYKLKSPILHSHSISTKSNQTLKNYLKSSEPIKALLHFRHRFRQNPCFIDSFSVLFALKASTQKSSSSYGIQIHTLVIKLGLESIIQIQTSLLQCYSAAGNLADARQMFDETPEKKNVVLWTALVSAYAENGMPRQAIELFRQMEVEKIELDEVIVTVALSACADLGALEMGERIYSQIRGKRGFTMDLSLRNGLINMYVKCGDMGKARKLFDETKRKDVTTWTSMIVGHALNGQAEDALALFETMKAKDQQTLIPNDVTFIGVLMACSHAGMVEEGKQQFRSMMEDYNLKPRDAHFGCMVDMFCRAGLLKDAYDCITKMPIRPTAVTWRTLLGACSLYGDIGLGEEAQRKLSELDPDYVGDYVALSNIYASKGMWDEKMKTRDRLMKRRVPGKSSIELGSIISEFVSGDDEHPMMGEISEVLKCLVVCIASFGGYSREFSCAL